MKYSEIKKAIQKEREDSLLSYIAYTERDDIISNFPLPGIPSDNQLIRAENEGLLTRDWDTLIVVKK